MRNSDEFKGKNVSQSMGFRGCGRRSLARIRRAPTALSPVARQLTLRWESPD